MPEDFSERVEKYSRLAQLAFEKANAHGGEERFNYLRLAQHWRKLARFSQATDRMEASHDAIGDDALPRRALLFLPLPPVR